MIGKLTYKVGIRLYSLIIFLASPFHPKASKLYQGRKHWKKPFLNSKANVEKTAWFHCASLGEFEQGRPVMEAFRETYPSFRIVLTFFSPSGYEVRKNTSLADIVTYLPADTPKNAFAFCDAIKPTIAFFVKYEFWHFYLAELKKRDVPIISFSALFRKSFVFFKPYGGFYRKMLHQFDHILLQDEQSSILLKSIDVMHHSLAGDTRFDRVAQAVSQKKKIAQVESFLDGKRLCIVIGSSWESDLEVIAPALTSLSNSLQLIIAPHEIGQHSLETTERYLQHLNSVRYSEYQHRSDKSYDMLLVDNIGMLTSLYQYAKIAYVGGAFGKGLHNILEPASFGIPVILGANYTKFQEATDLVQMGGAFSVSNIQTFKQVVFSVLENAEKRSKVGQIASDYVHSKQGATQKVMETVQQLLPY